MDWEWRPTNSRCKNPKASNLGESDSPIKNEVRNIEPKKRTQKVLLSNRALPVMTRLIAILEDLATSCDKEKEKLPEKKVVRPGKIMTVTSSDEAFKRRLSSTVRASKRVELYSSENEVKR